MRSVISETGVEVFAGGERELSPPAENLLRKLGRWLFIVRPAVRLHDTPEEPRQKRRAGLREKIRNSLLEHRKVYRRDTFYYSEDLGYLPQRSLKRHSAFLVYQRKYYQTIEQSRLKKS